MLQAQSLFGLVMIPLLAWALSERRRALAVGPTLRFVAAAILIQIAVAGLMLNVPPIRALFDYPARGVEALQEATVSGVQLVFGYLAGGPQPFEVTRPESGFVLAFQALPLILLISVLAKLLYYWGVLQRLVYVFAWALKRTLGVSGPVGTAAAANIFVGMVEAPLLVKPYLAGMSRSGLFATMTVGMSTVAGTVLALYATILNATVPGAAGHLIVASVISVPAALLVAALMVPDGGEEQRVEQPVAVMTGEEAPRSSMDAIAQGTREGVVLLVNVTAMLVVAVALVALANLVLGAATRPMGFELTLEQCLGWAFAVLAWLIGIPWSEAPLAGSLLGIKTVLNELIAYLKLAAVPADQLSERSRLIMTYALCGFANMGSLGIMIGGLVAMVPERRADIVALGARTVVSGTLATLMTAAVVGVLTP